MARFGDVNLVFSTNFEATFRLKEYAKAAGWTVPQSGDGLSAYSATSDVITGFGSGAGGYGNTRAWFILREPGGRREYTIQNGGSGGSQMRIKYSALDRFTGGAPSANTTPDATDEQPVAGSGTSASPSYASYYAAVTSYRGHIVFESTPVNGAYFFAFYGTELTTGTTRHQFIQDPIQAGTHSSEDADPIALHCSSYNSVLTPKAWAYFGSAAQAWMSLNAFALAPVPSGGVADPLGRDPVLPYMYSSASYWKGIGAYVKGKTMSRTYPSTINRDTDCYVYWQNMLYPFKTGVDPQL